MSLSSAISNAVSGLSAVSRGTELVSANIANALTPGYARRELDLSSHPSQGGINVQGVSRAISAGLLADNRLAMADLGSSETMAAFHAAMEQAFGTGTETYSLGTSLTDLEAALTGAAARPDSEIQLSAVLNAATALAGKINEISDQIQAERNKADQAIEQDVLRLNAGLEQVAKLNAQIVTLSAQGGDASSLIDLRQAAIDDISDILPVSEVPRENGRVALFTPDGAILLDGTEPARIGFSPTPGITAGSTLANGGLSTLTFNGKPLTAAQQSMLDGGSLGAHFAIRDQIAPGYQQQIDAFAHELYRRLSDPAVDPSLGAGMPGLFTDAQGAFDPADETGFAGRITVNSLVDPDAGGNLWRIRAGLDASGPGNAGESALLSRLGDALSAMQSPASASLSAAPRSLQTLTSELSSFAATNRLRAEAEALKSSAHQSGIQAALLAQGVDTDREMENLLALERAYAANARVFQAANDMLDSILGLT